VANSCNVAPLPPSGKYPHKNKKFWKANRIGEAGQALATLGTKWRNLKDNLSSSKTDTHGSTVENTHNRTQHHPPPTSSDFFLLFFFGKRFYQNNWARAQENAVRSSVTCLLAALFD